GLLLCATILVITVFEKFLLGGWVTLVVTGSVIALAFIIRRHYTVVTAKLGKLYQQLMDIPKTADAPAAEPDPSQATAAILVAGYGGLGLHTFLTLFRQFPNHFKGVV